MCFCICVPPGCGVCRGQKGVLDPLELKLQVVVGHPMWALGTKSVL